METKKTSQAYLWWFIFLAGIIWLLLSDILPIKFKFAEPQNVYYGFVEAELFFVLLLWPIFIPKILEAEISLGTSIANVPMLLIQIVAFFILALPLAVICLNIGELGWQALLKGQFFVFILASVVALLFNVTFKRGKDITHLYYFVVFMFSAGAPFLYFILREYEGKELFALPLLSPFYSSLYIIGS